MAGACETDLLLLEQFDEDIQRLLVNDQVVPHPPHLTVQLHVTLVQDAEGGREGGREGGVMERGSEEGREGWREKQGRKEGREDLKNDNIFTDSAHFHGYLLALPTSICRMASL